MKAAILCLVAAIAVTGCYERPMSVNRTNNNNISVELLFEHEGIKVYRFTDGPKHVYYTDARGATVAIYQNGKKSELDRVETVR